MTADLAFEPEAVTVSPGTTVTWTNVGGIEHTVTAYEDRIPDGAEYFASGGFDSQREARTRMSAGLVGPDEQFERAFEVSGTYEYFCIPHEGSGMTGTVRVR